MAFEQLGVLRTAQLARVRYSSACLYLRMPRLASASSSGHEKVVESLLDAGADKEVKDNKGNTALALAEMFKKHDVVTLLERS